MPDSSIWNFESLKEHLDSRIDAVERAAVLALAGSDKAMQKAEVSVDDRLKAMNEFRASLTDQTSTFANKEAVEFRLTAIDKQLATLAGKTQGVGLSMGVIVQLISTLAAATAVILFLRH